MCLVATNDRMAAKEVSRYTGAVYGLFKWEVFRRPHTSLPVAQFKSGLDDIIPCCQDGLTLPLHPFVACFCPGHRMEQKCLGSR